MNSTSPPDSNISAMDSDLMQQNTITVLFKCLKSVENFSQIEQND